MGIDDDNDFSGEEGKKIVHGRFISTSRMNVDYFLSKLLAIASTNGFRLITRGPRVLTRAAH
jgi:hypothetical protein